MSIKRREFLVGGLGLMVGGCTAGNQYVAQPAPNWYSPGSYRAGTNVARRAPMAVAPTVRPTYTRSAARPAQAPQRTVRPVSTSAIRTVPRTSWAKAAPIRSRLNPMRFINRITVHHEGWTPVYFTDYASTKARMDSIRRSHLERMKAGDIGYHYVIDRAGHVWQGRDLRYQGAHVGKNNENNLGIMVLGNFNKQTASSQQLGSLQNLLRQHIRTYRIAQSRVYTHRELGPTTCPGTRLQSYMTNLRRSGRLA
jgi:N-acetylmuramoyl-L-alanine amidase